jgi:hypothetical protein
MTTRKKAHLKESTTDSWHFFTSKKLPDGTGRWIEVWKDETTGKYDVIVNNKRDRTGSFTLFKRFDDKFDSAKEAIKHAEQDILFENVYSN